MDNQKFIEYCKQLVKNYIQTDLDYDIYTVWLNKTLQNNKALVSTTLSDGMYYEITYNGDKKEVYLDAYKKVENRCINLDI